MHRPDAEPFQVLRAKMEDEWTPQMMEILGIKAEFENAPKQQRAGDDEIAAAERRAKPVALWRKLSLVRYGSRAVKLSMSICSPNCPT
jgi:hypothetical protein